MPDRRFSLVGRELRGRALAARSLVDRALVADPSIHWVFVVNFPNGGSTAFAGLLLTADRAVALTDRAEGQWLLPSLSRPVDRWDPSLRVPTRTLRAVWLHAARRRGGPGELTVIEKSPPNMCRLEQILETFRAMPTSVITLSRDPFATCASWHQRYRGDVIRRTWDPEAPDPDVDERAWFERLASLWVDRARMLLVARQVSRADLTYEQVCADPATTLAKVAAVVPLLASADIEAGVAVKDYPRQPLQDMNERQIGLLTSPQVEAIADRLERDRDTVEALGYTSGPPGGHAAR